LRSNQEWRAWGKIDPLWSVASWPGKERGGPRPWTPEEFLALGASDFRDILGHWRQYGLTAGTCVEIGCGAGRMTTQLLTVFPRIEALDVSEDQMNVARGFLGTRADRVRFHLVDGPAIPLPDGSCTAMFSSHVFQHISQFTAIVRYLEETFRVLSAGGTVCFHIPVPGAHRGAPSSPLRLLLHNVAAKVRRVLHYWRFVEYHRYSAVRILGTLDTIGFQGAELRVFDMTSNGDAHSFFFARRP
jgi:SAM-dependent methyltransferase